MSGRIRTIKPELLDDERVQALSDRAFRLFIGCITRCDDYGNCRWTSPWLRGQVFWGKPEVTLESVVLAQQELLGAVPGGGLMSAYQVHDQWYAHVSGWDKHQRVDHPGKPRVPSVQESNGFEHYPSSSRESRESLATDLRSPISDLRSGSPTSNVVEKDDTGSVDPSLEGSTPKAHQDALGRVGVSETSQTSTEGVPIDSGASSPEQPTGSRVTDEPAFRLEPPTVIAERLELNVTAVLECWAGQSYHGRKPKLTSERRKRVTARLRDGFTPKELMLAVRGAAFDDWLMGRHPETKERGGYRDIETILRDAKQVERLVTLATQNEKRTKWSELSELEKSKKTLPKWAPPPDAATFAVAAGEAPSRVRFVEILSNWPNRAHG